MNKLELNWIGKHDPQNKINPEPRILVENKEYCYSAEPQGQIKLGVENNAIYDNMLIHGDNLLALKSLQQDFNGQVQLVYCDVPYNTQNAFEYYDDNLEHSIWLNLMKPRFELIRNLMRNDGFFCCQIDDSEGHYLKVLLDEIFGRSNYLTTLYIRVRYADKTLKSDMDFHKEIEQIHVYRKQYGAKPNLNKEVVGFDKFCYFVEELEQGTVIELGGKKVEIFTKDKYRIVKKDGSEYGLKEIWASGTILDGNSSGRFFRDYFTGRYEFDGYGVLYKVYGIGDDRYDYRYFTGPNKVGATKGKYFQGVPNDKLNADEIIRKLPINNFYDLAGNFGNCRLEGGVDFRSGKKPEVLLEFVLKHFSNEGDIVLDSFLGSGTTAAVAHKMNRRFIGIELGEHCYTHCYPRFKAVVDGEQGGISKAVNWQGGGGFKFYELAPTLLQKDQFGNLVISDDYNAEKLAQAMAKHEGYTYAPDENIVWKQGHSGDKHHIFTTTHYISPEYLDYIASELPPDEFLLICAEDFETECMKRHKNITIHPIPRTLLGKCEFGAEGYNLNVNAETEVCDDGEE